MKKFAVIALFLFLLTGCTSMTVIDPNGYTVKSYGGFLVNREGLLKVTHSWLDEKNVLHQETIEQSGKENSDSQMELIKFLTQIAITKATIPTP